LLGWVAYVISAFIVHSFIKHAQLFVHLSLQRSSFYLVASCEAGFVWAVPQHMSPQGALLKEK
jgi:hypothetical protein